MSKGKENVKKGMGDTTEDIHILAVPHMQINGRIKKNCSEEDLRRMPFKINTQSSLSIAQEIFTEISKVGTFIVKEWNSYLNLLTSKNENMLNSLIREHDAQLKKDFSKFILRNITKKPLDTDIERMRTEYKKKFRPTIKVIHLYKFIDTRSETI
jgi:Fe-S cluster biosynthesis and repair protein YggX